MTSKGVLRYLIAVVLVFIVFSVAMPVIGIPRDRLLPPPLVYASAKTTGTAYITKKDEAPTTNWFKVGDIIYLVTYQYRAPALPTYGKPVTPGQTAVYIGRAHISSEYNHKLVIGQTVPIRFDPQDPEISGMTADGGGPNGQGAAAILGTWILYALAVLAVAYPVAMLLERIMLRESY